MANYLIFGAAGHARVVADCVECCGGKVAGCLDSFQPASGATGWGIPILGGEQDAGRLAEMWDAGVVVAVGDNWGRAQVAERLRRVHAGLRFPTLIHPSAQVSRHTTIGEGTVILAGAVVNAGANIGSFCLLNTRCSLDHDSVMGDFSSLAPSATVGGNVNIGAYAAISLGASVIHRIRIGAHAVVGAGAVVVRDVPDFTVSFGNPAQARRTRQTGERYL
jgi:sugar O-acyltransferase (sialic acid O-acetyltransferase NeuD family)